MAADTNTHTTDNSHIRTHTKDYAKFIGMLKMSVIAIAIVAATVLYIISH